MGRVTITEQEILEEIFAASTGVRQPEERDALTTTELVTKTGLSEDRVRQLLHNFADQSRLEVVTVWRTCLDGRQQKKPAYRVLPRQN